jgi:hypothetical protein
MLGGPRCGLLIKSFNLFNDMPKAPAPSQRVANLFPQRPVCSGIFMVHGAPELAHGRFQIV